MHGPFFFFPFLFSPLLVRTPFLLASVGAADLSNLVLSAYCQSTSIDFLPPIRPYDWGEG